MHICYKLTLCDIKLRQHGLSPRELNFPYFLKHAEAILNDTNLQNIHFLIQNTLGINIIAV